MSEKQTESLPQQEAPKEKSQNRVLKAFWTAVEKAKSMEGNWAKRAMKFIGVFVAGLFRETKGIMSEKLDVSRKTAAKISEKVQKTLGKASDALKSNANLPEDVKQNSEVVLAYVVRGVKSMDEADRSSVFSGIKKVDKSIEGGEAEPLDAKEATSLLALSFDTILSLKQKYSNPAAFKKVLLSIQQAYKGKQFSWEKLFSASTLKVFKLSDSDGFSFLKKLGIVKGFQIGKAKKAAETMSIIAKNSISNKEKSELVGFMSEHIFKHTSKGNLEQAVTILNQMILKGEGTLSVDKFTELAFLIDNGDFENLIQMLTGKKRQEMLVAKAA